MAKKSIWIVVPAYNEAAHIGTLLKKILKYSRNVIIVDDGSTDATSSIVKKYPVVVLKHAVNLGKGSALLTGVEYAFKHKNAIAIVTLDADEQHDPRFIPQFLHALENGANVVVGNRPLITPMPKFRQLSNALLSKMVHLMFGFYIPDILSGYRAFTAEAFHSLNWNSRGYGVEVEMAIAMAKKAIPYQKIEITTLYHSYERGMTIIDAAGIVLKILALRIFP